MTLIERRKLIFAVVFLWATFFGENLISASTDRCSKLRTAAIKTCQKHGEKSQICIDATKAVENCK